MKWDGEFLLGTASMLLEALEFKHASTSRKIQEGLRVGTGLGLAHIAWALSGALLLQGQSLLWAQICQISGHYQFY